MDTATLLSEVATAGGEWTVNGLKLSIRPKAVLTPEMVEHIKANTIEVIAAIENKDVSAYEAESFEAVAPKKPKPHITADVWIARVKRHLLTRGAYYQWPAACLDGRNDISGNPSLLEFLEQQDGGVTLNVDGMFAFSITGSRLADDGETVLNDFIFERWAFDEVGVAQLHEKARKAALLNGRNA